MDTLPTNLTQAKELQSKFYFTGKPCKQGHIDKRLTSSKTCYTCDKVRSQAKPKRCRKEYYTNNKEIILEKQVEWRQKNKSSINAKTARRRAAKINATPSWADLAKIKDIYNNCPRGMVVDHIIPLKNKVVCGLHIESNLQYLTPKDNAEKGNKFTDG